MFESEKRRIAERIKDFIKINKSEATRSVMLKNGQILDFDDYRKMVTTARINPNDAYVYISLPIWIDIGVTIAFYYPFLRGGIYTLLNAYLSKLGFYYKYDVVPATGLKYVADAKSFKGYLSIELVNLVTVANNTNLRKIVAEVLDGKLISGDKVLTDKEYWKIIEMFASQRLFAGHNFDKAWNIVDNYYTFGSKSLAKEVDRIVMDYERIFQRYRFCYDMKTWKEIDCLLIKL